VALDNLGFEAHRHDADEDYPISRGLTGSAVALVACLLCAVVVVAIAVWRFR
jgi:homoserine kinase